MPFPFPRKVLFQLPPDFRLFRLFAPRPDQAVWPPADCIYTSDTHVDLLGAVSVDLPQQVGNQSAAMRRHHSSTGRSCSLPEACLLSEQRSLSASSEIR